mmetsp:Transcript_35579/g.36274  ORF Transcript_35579/g.36274 Transcript_35579/m.36274 type:complete len:107 (+) Transcript_35579:136-456(+)|eukprot:CAMPEP_0182425468 /NCGR_PEP_ID=MMETSP1167-20130531/11911_1 /TAXON_ID=2988 /ORGANISM="Mallomonas Sp, Strain CCMP3275" /LENGTH=106 /DNA_ID=CAMNT_0024606223 /DNA_START=126 /DNA_END=446 /DNA_ORIENTATION=+
MTMYVRLKRKNQTVFLHVEPSDNFSQIKKRIGEIFNQDPMGIMLMANDKRRELVDLATISDQEIKNDDVMYMVFSKESGSGWEDLQVDSFLPFGEENSEEPSGKAP